MVDIIGGRKYVEIPGQQRHELPPLLVNVAHQVGRIDKMVKMAADIVESEDMVVGDDNNGRRRMDMAINLVEQYLSLVVHWRWGDSVLEWIRQCEITFGHCSDLRNLLRDDLWPHSGRSSLVTLLVDKAVPTRGILLEKAVGLRLTFRQPPPIACCTNQFLFYLNSTVATSVYQTWAGLNPQPVLSLPPERFHFQLVNMEE